MISAITSFSPSAFHSELFGFLCSWQFLIFADAKVQSWVGATVWDSAVRLSRYLDSSEALREGLEHRNVCEVGAGTGLVGLVAGAMGANVTLTDVKSSHKHLQVYTSAPCSRQFSFHRHSLADSMVRSIFFSPVLAKRLILSTCSATSTLIVVF
jgi:hypothetical protein